MDQMASTFGTSALHWLASACTCIPNEVCKDHQEVHFPALHTVLAIVHALAPDWTFPTASG